MRHRVIVAGLQIIEAGFGVVVVATVAHGVKVDHVAGGGNDVAPRVIGVAPVAAEACPRPTDIFR